MMCPACAAEVPEEDAFCEHCGERVGAAPDPQVGCGCGAELAEVDEDGFCGVCGKRVRRPASDHVEQAVSATLAGVSDRGLRHEKNEDRFQVASLDHAALLVVCDGVSSTRQAEAASETVVRVVTRHALQALQDGAQQSQGTEVLSAAIQEAAQELRDGGNAWSAESAPSTTVVAALVHEGWVTVAWMGDSRAYWQSSTGVRPLTVDHSWLQAVVESGQMTQEEAERAPQAHAITRWVGADADPAWEPQVVTERLAGPGTLLLCTDGLWNYATAPAAMQEVLREASQGAEQALEIARNLVTFAIDEGGQDNITVALLVVGEPETEQQSESS